MSEWDKEGWAKKRYEKRKADGLCTMCGKAPPGEGVLKCSDCEKKTNERGVKIRQRCREQGICISCLKKPARPNRRLCSDCAKEHSAREKRRRARLVQRNLCQRCGKRPPKLNQCLCAECRQRIRETKWGGVHWHILERDSFRCQICGREKNLVVHHKDDHGEHTNHPNNDPDNLVTLCRFCHNHITRFRRHNWTLASELILYPS